MLRAAELDTRLLGMVVALVVIWVLFNLGTNGQFLSSRNLWNLSVQTATVAIMASAFTINGLIPGPLLFRDNPEVAWTIIASLLVGNFLLLILNVPFARVWIQLLKTPFAYLTITILAFMFIGTYSIKGNTFDIYVLVGAGLVAAEAGGRWLGDDFNQAGRRFGEFGRERVCGNADALNRLLRR